MQASEAGTRARERKIDAPFSFGLFLRISVMCASLLIALPPLSPLFLMKQGIDRLARHMAGGAFIALQDFHESTPMSFIVLGAAGTGKTTMIETLYNIVSRAPVLLNRHCKHC